MHWSGGLTFLGISRQRECLRVPGYSAYLLPRAPSVFPADRVLPISIALLPCRSRKGCSSRHSSGAPYITAVSPRRRPCRAFAVRCSFTLGIARRFLPRLGQRNSICLCLSPTIVGR